MIFLNLFPQGTAWPQNYYSINRHVRYNFIDANSITNLKAIQRINHIYSEISVCFTTAGNIQQQQHQQNQIDAFKPMPIQWNTKKQMCLPPNKDSRSIVGNVTIEQRHANGHNLALQMKLDCSKNREYIETSGLWKTMIHSNEVLTMVRRYHLAIKHPQKNNSFSRKSDKTICNTTYSYPYQIIAIKPKSINSFLIQKYLPEIKTTYKFLKIAANMIINLMALHLNAMQKAFAAKMIVMFSFVIMTVLNMLIVAKSMMCPRNVAAIRGFGRPLSMLKLNPIYHILWIIGEEKTAYESMCCRYSTICRNLYELSCQFCYYSICFHYYMQVSSNI